MCLTNTTSTIIPQKKAIEGYKVVSAVNPTSILTDCQVNEIKRFKWVKDKPGCPGFHFFTELGDALAWQDPGEKIVKVKGYGKTLFGAQQLLMLYFTRPLSSGVCCKNIYIGDEVII